MKNKQVVLILLLIGFLGLQGMAEGKRIGVVISRQLEPYQDALRGIQQQSGISITQFSMNGDREQGVGIFRSMTPEKTDLVIVMGAEALQIAREHAVEVPLVYTMIYEKQGDGILKKSSGVIMQMKLEDQFNLIKRILPTAKNVGVIYSMESAAEVNRARSVAEKCGLKLIPIVVDDASQIDQALNKVGEVKSDVLWSVLDKVVSKPESVRKVIDGSLTRHLPFIGLSEFHVKAGALAAFTVDFQEIGRQTIALANEVISNPSLARVENPRSITVCVNRKTQHALGLADFPDTLKLKYVEE